MTATVLSLDSISDYLGPAETRFFGSGYRRADYHLAALRHGPDGIQSTVTVEYPRDWSRKQVGNDLRPHLSTVDALVFSARMADVLLATEFGLGPDERSQACLVGATIQAGMTPQESLENLPLRAWVEKASDSDTATTTVHCTVGQMRVRLSLEHPPPATAAVTGALATSGQSYWGNGFRSDAQTLTDVVADLDALRCTGVLTVQHGHRGAAAGLEDGAHHRVSLIDAFVSHVQLAQVLLYEMDGVARHESNTLWMQHTTLQRDLAISDPPGPSAIAVDITRADVLRVGAARWRDIAFTGQVAGVTQRSVFAHRLPDRLLTRSV